MEIGGVNQGAVSVGINQVEEMESKTKSSFAAVFENLLTQGQLMEGMQQRLEGMQIKTLQSNQLSPRDLLLLQVEVGRFNMGVELVGKVAESASATIRRLQGN